ncbi:hypothetical protein L218DRAFT_588313 [Marasmius fiardii PR-910]|nr:hypothetical protein L218DRAFT_588313 [Marasmius fiardii PR-910]
MHIFIPPLSPAWIDNKHCICWPLTETLYYWSLDLDGQAPITTEDLRDYGIRVLSHSVNFEAVFNRTPYYEATLNHIQSLNYDPYSLEYAQGQGHELMVRPGGNQGQNLACQTPTELPTNPPPPPPGEDFDLHVHTTPTATLQHHPTDSWLRKLFRQVQSLARAVVICSLCKAESFGERLPVPQGDDGGRDQAH